jgi:hypothetical protein
VRLQRRFFDRDTTGEADQGAEDREEETEPVPQGQANACQGQ